MRLWESTNIQVFNNKLDRSTNTNVLYKSSSSAEETTAFWIVQDTAQDLLWQTEKKKTEQASQEGKLCPMETMEEMDERRMF